MEFTHAGAMETAAMLAYEPGLVHLDQAGQSSDLASGATAHELFRQRDVYPVLQDFHDIAPTGWYGRPERADQGRAEEIAEAVADHVVRRVREIWAQLADRDGPVPPGQVPPGRDGPSAVAAGAQR
jgi:creatinine amidohydrolase/Fe(II)-dependent formamide hydrolase-like protein